MRDTTGILQKHSSENGSRPKQQPTNTMADAIPGNLTHSHHVPWTVDWNFQATPAELGALAHPKDTTSPATSLRTSSPSPTTLSQALPADTVKVLQQLPKGKFFVRAFTKEIDGTPRTLVILGERHHKDKQSFEHGKDVTSRFQYLAVEGLDPSKLWAGAALAAALRAFQAARLIVNRKDSEYDSNIKEARNESRLSEFRVDVEKKIAAVIKEHGLKSDQRESWGSIFVNLDGETSSMAAIAGATYQLGRSEITGESLLERAFQLAKSPETPLENHRPRQQVFGLEERHKPMLPEQLAAMALPATVASAAALIGASFLPAGAVATSIEYTIAAIAVPSVLALRLLQPYLVEPRNRSFVESNNRIFSENPKVDTLLNIVGRDHVQGMGKLLVDEHGWQELEVC